MTRYEAATDLLASRRVARSPNRPARVLTKTPIQNKIQVLPVQVRLVLRAQRYLLRVLAYAHERTA